MGGSDDHVATLENCFPPDSFPRTLSSSMTSDEFGSRSAAGFNSENQFRPSFPGPGKIGQPSNLGQRWPSQPGVGFRKNDASDSNVWPEPKPGRRGGLAERMAARAGFSAPPRLNTEDIRPHELYTNPDVGSPYLTIPAGLSPTTLLESPVFLSNSMVQPSPTTGKFQFGPSRNIQDTNLMADNRDMGNKNTFDDFNASSFAFKPVTESTPFARFDTPNKSFPTGDVLVHPERQSTDPLKSQQGNSVLFHQSNFSLSDQSHCLHLPNNSPPSDGHLENVDGRIGEDPTAGGSSGEDGYSWRKYGQKHVKGSDYPRSYYKCTHQNCPVKKKIEQSHEGYITEIIYKGAHNHPKPSAGRRSGHGPTNAFENMQPGLKQCGPGPNGDPVWSGIERTNFVGVPEWKPDNLERTSSFQLGREYHSGAQYELADGMEESSAVSNNEEDDRVTHGSVSLGNDDELDESESKRRRMETYAREVCGATRAIREPRVVVQTTSEVDILDDGYRWRKYGQKVVKGNPNPRSYYKCTSPGCNVRKHVERAAHDLKSVITTYEGKHNHEVPTARNSGNLNARGPNTLPTQQAADSANHLAQPEPGPISGRPAWLERLPLTSFGLLGRPQVGPGFGFGMNQPGPVTLGLAGLRPHHLYAGNQPHLASEMAYMMPKEELKLEPVMDSGLNSAIGSSSYQQQLMNRLRLGPQM